MFEMQQTPEGRMPSELTWTPTAEQKIMSDIGLGPGEATKTETLYSLIGREPTIAEKISFEIPGQYGTYKTITGGEAIEKFGGVAQTYPKGMVTTPGYTTVLPSGKAVITAEPLPFSERLPALDLTKIQDMMPKFRFGPLGKGAQVTFGGTFDSGTLIPTTEEMIKGPGYTSYTSPFIKGASEIAPISQTGGINELVRLPLSINWASVIPTSELAGGARLVPSLIPSLSFLTPQFESIMPVSTVKAMTQIAPISVLESPTKTMTKTIPSLKTITMPEYITKTETEPVVIPKTTPDIITQNITDMIGTPTTTLPTGFMPPYVPFVPSLGIPGFLLPSYLPSQEGIYKKRKYVKGKIIVNPIKEPWEFFGTGANMQAEAKIQAMTMGFAGKEQQMKNMLGFGTFAFTKNIKDLI
jgi:hypothetical protein